MDIQKSKKVRVVKFILGGIIVGFSAYRFLNIFNTTPFWATYPGIAVLVIGIINILKGIFSKSDSKMTRSIETGIGIIAIIVGLFVKAYISDTSSKLTWFIFLFLIIQGIGFIATGITQSKKAKISRIPKIIIGTGIIVILMGVLLEHHDLSIKVMTVLLSVNILIIGMEIITGAINHKIVKRS
jgi:uncharacterized membrane protein HdeD (DUF308 family)